MRILKGLPFVVVRVVALAPVVSFVGALAGCGPGLVGGGGGGEGEGEGEGDAGEGEDEPREPIDVGPPPSGYATTPPASASGTCSTGQWWTRGDRESTVMHPGGDCIDCHTERREGPRYTIAGTVFQALDDETDCRGIADARVEIIGSDGAVAFSLTANSAGNFFSTRSLAGIAPYTARVVYDGRQVEMATPQTDGACNHCHTAEGTEGAPGRIVVP